MSLIAYDLSFLVLFTLAVVIFLIIERKKLVREGLMFLYKTQIGVKFMDKIAKKYPKTLKFFSYVIILTGIILMIASIYFIFDILKMFMNPAFVKIVKIPPITPLIPYMDTIFRVTWLPPLYFTYWIIAIALVAIFHEGFHGIFARFYKVGIKSSGFGFLGPFLAFFVEQDNKQMQKAKPFSQMTILGAGVFANVLLTIIFVILMLVFSSVAYMPAGATFNDYVYGVAPISALVGMQITDETINLAGVNLTKINLENNSYFVQDSILKLNLNATDPETIIKLYYDMPAIRAGLVGAIFEINEQEIKSNQEITRIMGSLTPGETIKISTLNKNKTTNYILNYEIKLAQDPNNSSRALIGIATLAKDTSGFKKIISNVIELVRKPNVYYVSKIDGEFVEFIYNLLFWMIMINFGVALANMWPVAIFDGGFFFYLIVLSLTKNKKIAERALKISTTIFLAAMVLMMLFWAKGLFF